MNNHTLKTIMSVGILIIAFFIALSVLKWAVRILLPIAIIIIAAYIVYRVFSGRRY
ncbi:MAG: hypothetical protein N2484_04070 [Clostridia bacterium]|nr:hypothetical protein [Clostridia bacterium]